MSDFVIRPDGGRSPTSAALADRLDRFDSLLEVGIGRRTDVAELLVARGCSVTATDVHDRSLPDGIRFVVDDVTDPDVAAFAGVDAVYALNLPPELHRPTLELAAALEAAFAFTTLGGDPPVVAARPETVPGDTLFWARE